MTETFALTLVGEEPDCGWLVDAESAGAAVDRVRAQTRARQCARGELLVWTERRYRERHLKVPCHARESPRLTLAGRNDRPRRAAAR